MPSTPSEKKMPSTAPSAAPDEAPRMSGDTSGLRNRPWNAVPATASAAPTSDRREHARPAHLQHDVLDRRRHAGGPPVSVATRARSPELGERHG